MYSNVGLHLPGSQLYWQVGLLFNVPTVSAGGLCIFLSSCELLLYAYYDNYLSTSKSIVQSFSIGPILCL